MEQIEIKRKTEATITNDKPNLFDRSEQNNMRYQNTVKSEANISGNISAAIGHLTLHKYPETSAQWRAITIFKHIFVSLINYSTQTKYVKYTCDLLFTIRLTAEGSTIGCVRGRNLKRSKRWLVTRHVRSRRSLNFRTIYRGRNEQKSRNQVLSMTAHAGRNAATHERETD